MARGEHPGGDEEGRGGAGGGEGGGERRAGRKERESAGGGRSTSADQMLSLSISVLPKIITPGRIIFMGIGQCRNLSYFFMKLL